MEKFSGPRKKITILCRNLERVRNVIDYLSNKGMTVDVETNPKGLINRHGKGPDYIFISKEFEAQFGEAVKDLFKKKFSAVTVPFEEATVTPQSMGVLFEKFQKTSEVNDTLEAQQVSDHLYQKLNELLKKVENSDLSDDTMLNLSSLRIFDPTTELSFVFAIPDVDKELVDSVLRDLKSIIAENIGFNYDILHLDQKITLKDYKQLKKGSERSIQGTINGLEIAISVFQGQVSKEELEVIGNADLCSVEIEEWWCKIPLPCHTYLWFEKNNKKVLYIKSGDLLSPGSHSRFNKMGQSKMYVDINEISKYMQLKYFMSLKSKLVVSAV